MSSIDQIIKAAHSKRKPKKRMNVAAADERYTGSEPIWDDWQSWPTEKFWSERSRALNFYNYYSTAKDSKPAVVEWMESRGYTKDDIRAIKNAPDYSPGITTGSLCTCMNRGMPPLHPNAQEHVDSMNGLTGDVRSDELFARENILAAIALGNRAIHEEKIQVENGTSKNVVISPMVRLQKKCLSTMIMDLDLLMDEWCKSGDIVRVIPVYSAMQGHGLPAAACPQVEAYLTKIHTEMALALNGEDEYISEGYSYLAKDQLTSRVTALASMISDLSKFKNTAKAARAPREKKAKSATKQIERIQYLKLDNTFKIASINPVRIIGACRLFTFNVKTRMLFDFGTASTTGFSVKGTTLQNADETMCRYIRLRKPEEFLQIILNGSSSQIEKAWAKLTTKEGKPKCRINKDMVLLRVI